MSESDRDESERELLVSLPPGESTAARAPGGPRIGGCGCLAIGVLLGMALSAALDLRTLRATGLAPDTAAAIEARANAQNLLAHSTALEPLRGLGRCMPLECIQPPCAAAADACPLPLRLLSGRHHSNEAIAASTLEFLKARRRHDVALVAGTGLSSGRLTADQSEFLQSSMDVFGLNQAPVRELLLACLSR
ncbi:hypothetical protein T492DRAFT_909439 [Pavlovales sp. CCMP2436]|nr:hypothetical protein T492DRAFT_909439 [Pavlovales sp. CCMP2436]